MMRIPKEIKDRKWPSAAGWGSVGRNRPGCWKTLHELSQLHDHDKDGNCILRNWSREDAKGNWRKST